ncbi:MAG TPA: diadenylate cyclase CdaA [Anaerolineales bacterium]|nr:diadenylate cyclase CdaA [Anaerolineales bacterium]
MPAFLSDLLANILFIFERVDLLDVIDLLLVTTIFYAILRLLRDTQAMVLLRGVLLLIALFGLISSLDVLPAFSWLVETTLPALVVAIPVIFAPEIRRALERLGRAGVIFTPEKPNAPALDTISAIVTAASRLSDRQHGALVVIQRLDTLDDYIRTGVKMDSLVTPELLLQVFYPNTPLHDGAAIISGERMVAAACVLPLSASGVLTRSPERQMGLRHRAALGISEVSDAVAVVVSEETGSISIVHGGRMIRRLDPERLENILRAFFKPAKTQQTLKEFVGRLMNPQPPDAEAK